MERLKRETLDVLIIGGGINGAGTARDLALRARLAGVPLKIGLVERKHFASGTSGKNSQLIHGGLRYLKYFQFGLVREALHERAVLLEIAPHLVEPQPFLMPICGHVARLYYGAGLWLYDQFAGGRRVGEVRRLSRQELRRVEPGLDPPGLTSGAIFYDCRVHAARLVLENIFEAVRNGAWVANYASVEKRQGGVVTLRDSLTGEVLETRARKIVDATGPWSRDPQPRLVRGSHLILPRFTARDHAIAYFEESGRILFLIPWGPKRDLTLLGTTDVDHTGGPDEVHISEDEVRYLLGIARTLYPGVPLGEPIATYSSLRPLLADGASSPTSATREHRIWNTPDGVLHITGGKYTTYRAMSEEAADLVAEEIAPELAKIHATAETPLSGRASAGVPQELELYGEQAEAVLRYLPEREPEGMTPLEAARLAYAVHHEMAQRLEDFLCASTYLGYERSWSEESLAPFRAEFLRHTQGAGA